MMKTSISDSDCDRILTSMSRELTAHKAALELELDKQAGKLPS